MSVVGVTVVWALQIQRLEGSRPPREPKDFVCGCAGAAEVQSCVLAAVGGSCSARSYSLRGLAEAGEKADRALWAS